MKRRDFCKALVCSAALAPGLALPRAEAAAKSQTVGRAVPAGNYTMSFRSELSQMDIEHEYYYSDSFFAHTSIQYDHQLALATLGEAITMRFVLCAALILGGIALSVLGQGERR